MWGSGRPWMLGDEFCRICNIFPILRKNERSLLQFVQQFGSDRLQIKENRLKFCNFNNIGAHMRFIPPFFCINYNIHWHTYRVGVVLHPARFFRRL